MAKREEIESGLEMLLGRVTTMKVGQKRLSGKTVGLIP